MASYKDAFKLKDKPPLVMCEKCFKHNGPVKLCIRLNAYVCWKCFNKP